MLSVSKVQFAYQPVKCKLIPCTLCMRGKLNYRICSVPDCAGRIGIWTWRWNGTFSWRQFGRLFIGHNRHYSLNYLWFQILNWKVTECTTFSYFRQWTLYKYTLLFFLKYEVSGWLKLCKHCPILAMFGRNTTKNLGGLICTPLDWCETSNKLTVVLFNVVWLQSCVTIFQSSKGWVAG